MAHQDSTLFNWPVPGWQFVVVWALAAVTYGAGDIITTLTILHGSTVVSEANGLIVAATETFGTAGLVGIKLAVFGCCLAISAKTFAARPDGLDTLTPPTLLTIVGAFVTTYNTVLLL